MSRRLELLITKIEHPADTEQIQPGGWVLPAGEQYALCVTAVNGDSIAVAAEQPRQLQRETLTCIEVPPVPDVQPGQVVKNRRYVGREIVVTTKYDTENHRWLVWPEPDWLGSATPIPLDQLITCEPFPERVLLHEDPEACYATIAENAFRPLPEPGQETERYFLCPELSPTERETMAGFYHAAIVAELREDHRRLGDEAFGDKYRDQYFEESGRQDLHVHDYLLHAAARAWLDQSGSAKPQRFNLITEQTETKLVDQPLSAAQCDQAALMEALTERQVIAEEVIATTFGVSLAQDSYLLRTLMAPRRPLHRSTRADSQDFHPRERQAASYLNGIERHITDRPEFDESAPSISEETVHQLTRFYIRDIHGSIFKTFVHRFELQEARQFGKKLDAVFQPYYDDPPAYLLRLVERLTLEHPESYYNRRRLQAGLVTPDQLNPRVLVEFLMEMIPTQYHATPHTDTPTAG